MAIIIDVSPKVRLPKKLTLEVQTSLSGSHESVILPHKNADKKPNLIVKVEKTEFISNPIVCIQVPAFPTVHRVVDIPSLLLPLFRGLRIDLQVPDGMPGLIFPSQIVLDNTFFDDVFTVKIDDVRDLPQLIIKQDGRVLFQHWIPLAKRIVKRMEISGIQDFLLDKNGKCFFVYSSFATDKTCGVYLHKDLPRETPLFEGLVIGEKGIFFKRSSHSRALKLSDVNLWDEILPYPDGFIGVSRNNEGCSQVWINGVYLIYQGVFDKVQAAPDGAVYVLFKGILTRVTLEWNLWWLHQKKETVVVFLPQFFLEIKKDKSQISTFILRFFWCLIITIFFIKNDINKTTFGIFSWDDTVNIVFSSSLRFSVFYFFDEYLEFVSIVLSNSFITDLISDFDQLSISFFSDFIGNLIWETRSWDRICLMMIWEWESMELGYAIFLYSLAGLFKIFLCLSRETTDDICSNRNLITIWTVEVSDFCEYFIKFIREISSVHKFEYFVRKWLNRKMKMRNKSRIFYNFKKLIGEILRINTGNPNSRNACLF